MGAAITALRNTPALRWANPLEVKNAVEVALADRFGAKEMAKPKTKVRLATAVWCASHPVTRMEHRR
jgi:glutaminyl-tRNA synthetase